jgi:Immunoglobulin I-set domain/FG-GAP repeat/FG-GAP-like repeat
MFRFASAVAIGLAVSAFSVFGAFAEEMPLAEAEATTNSVPFGFEPARTGPSFSHRAPSDFQSAEELNFGTGGRQFLLTYFNFPGGPNRAEPIRILRSDPRTHIFSDATAAHVGPVIPTMVHPRAATVGDFNGDGRQDLFIGAHGFDAAPFAGESDWLLLSGATTKRTARIAPPAVRTFTHAAASADINRDGLRDIYVGTLCCSTRGPYLLIGARAGLPVFNDSRLPAAVIDRTAVFTAAAFVDVDRDGWPDLILGTDGPGATAGIMYRNVRGSFASSPAVPLPVGLFGPAGTIVLDFLPMDVDTDGWTDLVLSSTKASPFYVGFGLQVLINTRTGRFRDETAARVPNGGRDPTGQWRNRLMRASFHGDAIGDIVGHRFCPSRAGSALAWINDGSGRFTPMTRSQVAPSDTSEDCGVWLPLDVNGDKRTDFARVRSVSSTSAVVDTHINKGLLSGAPAVAPLIVRAPAATVVAAGRNVTLSIAVRGSRPMTFEWRKGTTVITGAKGPSLTIRNATAQSAGTYSVKVTTRGGIVSRTATVTVN